MELVIKNIQSKSDKKLFIDLAKRIGLETATLTLSEKEDYALGEAIKDGRKSGYAEEADVIYILKKKMGK